MQDRVLLGLSASSQRPGSGQVTRRCCSPPPQASEHSLQEEVYQLRQGWAPQGRRAGGLVGPGWQWKGRSGWRSRVSTHCTSRVEEPPPQLREHLLQLPMCQAAQGRRWQRRAGWGRPAGAQSSSRPELQRTSLQTAAVGRTILSWCGQQPRAWEHLGAGGLRLAQGAQALGSHPRHVPQASGGHEKEGSWHRQGLQVLQSRSWG